MKMISCFRGQQVLTCAYVCASSHAGNQFQAVVPYALQNVSEPEVQTLRVALRAKEQRIDRQEEELRTCWQRINNLEVSRGRLPKKRDKECSKTQLHVVGPSLLAASCKLPYATVQHSQDISAYHALSLPFQYSLKSP